MRTAVVLVTMMICQAVMGSTSVSKASNSFAHKLYANLTQNQSGNLLYCPFSLNVALALVQQGAGGNTAAQLAVLLGFEDKEDIREEYLSLLQALKEEGDAVQVATKLFPAANFQINQEYVNLARKYFLSDVEGVNYAVPDEAARQINKYVEDNTSGKIQNLVLPEHLSELTKLIIVDAVYFQAAWKSKFPPAFDGEFKGSDGQVYKTQFMSQIAYVNYKHDPVMDADILVLPYKKNFSMFFILPKADDGLTAMETTLVNTNLENTLKDLTTERVHLTIPKFKLEETIQLKEVLQLLGVKDLFDKDAADLHGIAEGDSLVVTDVVQKTFLDVHETGTEAAAATEVQFAVSASYPSKPPIQFVADHPFTFGLLHNDETLLFYGRLAHPVS